MSFLFDDLSLFYHSCLNPPRELFRSIFSLTAHRRFAILPGMDKQIKRHLVKRGMRFAHGRPAKGLLGMDSGMGAFFRWFHENVMRFDSLEYRRRFWHEAYRNGHTIGHTPKTAVEFTDPRRHPYNEWLVNLAILVVAMGASAVVWFLVRTIDAHIRRLRRPTYYETERKRRLGLAEERRRIRRRTTTSPCPTPDMLRAAFEQARASTANMIRFGSMLEDLECYVDNSVVWSEVEGRIVGRRGGIRQWLRENAPDLSERYKTVMKYKALAMKFRQAVGVSDPVPAATILPPESPVGSESNKKKGKESMREHCSDQSRGEHKKPSDEKGRTPERVARALLGACEGTVASLVAQLALMVSADFVLNENIDRTQNGFSSGCESNRNGQRSRSTATRHVRSSA